MRSPTISPHYEPSEMRKLLSAGRRSLPGDTRRDDAVEYECRWRRRQFRRNDDEIDTSPRLYHRHLKRPPLLSAYHETPGRRPDDHFIIARRPSAWSSTLIPGGAAYPSTIYASAPPSLAIASIAITNAAKRSSSPDGHIYQNRRFFGRLSLAFGL